MSFPLEPTGPLHQHQVALGRGFESHSLRTVGVRLTPWFLSEPTHPLKLILRDMLFQSLFLKPNSLHQKLSNDATAYPCICASTKPTHNPVFLKLFYLPPEFTCTRFWCLILQFSLYCFSTSSDSYVLYLYTFECIFHLSVCVFVSVQLCTCSNVCLFCVFLNAKLVC